MKACAALLLALFLWRVHGHKLLNTPSSPVLPGSQSPSPSPSNGTYFPPGWDVPVFLMSRGDLLARGGAMRALGKEKLTRIKICASVNTTVEALANTLDSDKDIFVDPNKERLLFKCESLIYLDNATTAAADSSSLVSAAATYTKAEIFSLSSKPGAPKRILLDFDGQLVENTWWNSEERPSIQAKPYDKDNNPESFSQAELQDIYDIWRAVSEDFAALNVDVTTIDPGDAALLEDGVRIIIGGHSNDWYGSAAGGVAWVGSFGSGNPAFIWPALLGPFKAKYVADAASHECGHTLGLLHDGNSVSGTGYYAGQGDWAPIMGIPYAKDLTQFDRGEYSGSNNPQDDYNIMRNFLQILPQQHGSSIATATAMPSGNRIEGIISNPGQIDFFSFAAKPGPVTLAVSVTAATSDGKNIANLDTRLMLYDSTGAALRSANPAGSVVPFLGAKITTNLQAAGTYYVSVAGVGSGDMKGTGYSNYGSRGMYTLTASYTPSTGGPNPSEDSLACAGAWSEWGACSVTCGGGAQTSTFKVITPAKGTGQPCEAADGETRSRSCNTQSCPGGGGAPSMRVRKVQLTKATLSNGRVRCTARVTVRASDNAAVPNAYVTGSWCVGTSGQCGISASEVGALTGTNGIVKFDSAAFNPVLGQQYSCGFEVRQVVATGYRFVRTAAAKRRYSWK